MPKGVPRAGFRNSKNRTAQQAIQHSVGVGVLNFGEEPKPSKFSINERFDFVCDLVSMLSNGVQPSIIITGEGGLGKTYTVLSTLNKCGYIDISTDDDSDSIAPNSYRVIKGHSSPKGLYRTLYENRNNVVVFDDCDSVLNDPVSLNLLKGALDSYDKRIISWKVDMKDDDLPRSFEFQGRIIFISNRPSSSIDQAILSRSMTVDLSMTAQEKIERMYFLLNQPGFMPEYPMDHKKDALALIENFVDRIKELSLRTLISVTKIRFDNPRNDWKALAEYTLVG